MTEFQKIIKYLAMAFAILLSVSIIGGILSAVGLFGGFFDNDAVMKESKTYTVSSSINALEIKINAADFTIKQADGFSVESNLKYLTVLEKDGTLILEETKKFGNKYSNAKLTLFVAKEAEFKKADITTGAGRLTVDALSADSLHLELGAGEVNIEKLTATADADIHGGAGKITINGGLLQNLDLDMGVGQLNLTSALLGNSELDLGVGESNLTLIGSKIDYTLEIEKGIGSINLEGENVSSFKNFGNGINNIDIDGGVGAINLNFKEDDTK